MLIIEKVSQPAQNTEKRNSLSLSFTAFEFAIGIILSAVVTALAFIA